MLGVSYERGAGVPQDSVEAAKWYRLAAEQGNASAQFILGSLHLGGRHVPQDYDKAVKWLRLAAEQGYAIAQVVLGSLYLKGVGVPQDYVQAHMWFNLAAASYSTDEARRDVAVSKLNAVAKAMTPAQVAEAERLAREWKPK